ncbi:MAG: hypothetical protein EFT35_06250 [Methanophagales archaeon ANME-1-THS]|nr:MAG: hypothetical protein EFT35_06250 [Methanophagales archaeon ANME-1-THS]
MMTERGMERIQQRIYLSRKSTNAIEFEHEVLRIPLRAGEETSFELLISNYGDPTHVHFSLSEEIKDRVMILQDKVYVIDEEKIAAIVRLPKSYTAAVAELEAGEIIVSAGYGAAKRSFPVEIVEIKEKEKRRESTEERDSGEIVAVKGKEKTGLKLSAEERVLISRLTVSGCAAILFFILLFLIFRIFNYLSHHLFVSAFIASLLFMFIVIYNF